MVYYVGETGLITQPDNTIISWNIIEDITGKDLSSWSTTRLTRYVETKRVKGHLKFYDHAFVLHSKYRLGKTMYDCVHIDKHGYAVLTATNYELKVKSSNCPKDWEIVI